MLPKIKKKIISFIKDEDGSISKKKLISGAIIIAGISSLAKNIYAYYPGDHKQIKRPGLASGSKAWSCTTTEEPIGPTSVGYIKEQNCHSSGGSCSNPKKHSNNKDATHKNTNANFHKNIPSLIYDKNQKTIVASHNHHGQHSNHYVETQNSGKSHCSY
jgi:hypothetical protein